MIRLRRLALLLGCACPLFWARHSPRPTRPGAKTWVGRNQEIEEYLKTAECVSIEVVCRATFRPNARCGRVGPSPGWPGKRCLQASIAVSGKATRAEIAAYELDKLLKMDMVPPTVERQLDGSNGAAQQWVENVVDCSGPAHT